MSTLFGSIKGNTITATNSLTIADGWKVLSVSASGGTATLTDEDGLLNYTVRDGASVNIRYDEITFKAITITAGSGCTVDYLYIN